MRQLIQNAKIVQALQPLSVSSVTPDYVSLKNYQHVTAIISLTCSTGVAACDVTLKQATSVAAGGEKPLGFSYVWKNENIASSDTLVKTAVTSNTFATPANLNEKLYVIEVDSDALDTDAGFDCFRVALADAAATVASVVYVLSQPRFIDQTTSPAAITD